MPSKSSLAAPFSHMANSLSIFLVLGAVLLTVLAGLFMVIGAMLGTVVHSAGLAAAPATLFAPAHLLMALVLLLLLILLGHALRAGRTASAPRHTRRSFPRRWHRPRTRCAAAVPHWHRSPAAPIRPPGRRPSRRRAPSWRMRRARSMHLPRHCARRRERSPLEDQTFEGRRVALPTASGAEDCAREDPDHF